MANEIKNIKEQKLKKIDKRSWDNYTIEYQYQFNYKPKENYSLFNADLPNCVKYFIVIVQCYPFSLLQRCRLVTKCCGVL